jgi:predicted AAA+ superfamily ATPase
LKEKETRKRELTALTTAMEELRMDRGTLVTLYEKEEIKTPAGLIEVVPAWEWFLEQPPFSPKGFPPDNAR